MRLTIIGALAICLLGGCSAINKKLGLKNDNLLEEFLEDRFEEHTGWDVDFTPEDEETEEVFLGRNEIPREGPIIKIPPSQIKKWEKNRKKYG